MSISALVVVIFIFAQAEPNSASTHLLAGMTVVVLVVRVVQMWQRGLHYFLLDFCYYVNILTLYAYWLVH